MNDLVTGPLQKAKDFLKDESVLFVIKIMAVYFVWKVVLHFLHSPATGQLFKDWQAITFSFGVFYAKVTSGILNFFGEHTIQIGFYIQYIPSLRSIRVEEHCLAIPAMVIFTGSIVLFKGSWKNKLWFIPLGLLGVFLINTLRLVLLCVTFERFSLGFYQFNHSYVYVIFTYSMIFLLIVWWMRRFAFAQPAGKVIGNPSST